MNSIFIDSFSKYLSPLEEELILDVIRKNELPDNKDELNVFLERYQCRKVVNDENISKVILEIAKQELVQKPHPQLQKYSQFQSMILPLRPCMILVSPQ